jgi:recombinase-like zinc beta ribbon protein
VPRPDLAIIEDGLWTKVQHRLAENAAAYLRGPDGKLRGRPTGSGPTIKYLLTGLGVCAGCRGSMAIRTSGGLPRRAWLECLRYRTKGQRACSNRLRVALQSTEEAILAKMERDLLRPEVLLAAVQRVLATVSPSPAALERERTRLERQALTTERELNNLGAAVAAGGQLDTLISQLKDREAALAGLRATLTRLDTQEALAQLNPAALEARLRAKLADFTGLRQRHPAAARSLLKKLLSGRLRFTPITGPDRAYYRVEWDAAFGGLLSEELAALAPTRSAGAKDSASLFGGDPGGIRTRVYGPSRAFFVRSTGYGMLTQHVGPRD